ncbi:right-handed parallel beta-helix repeat-containing protein, partial [Membranihabitans maritimus]|uniref:right-handed parallel beta-helix repeat-containing protein n=1 Tax=Membranihabitans maritimus TaxID=2904244 RepID=UPI001F209174
MKNIYVCDKRVVHVLLDELCTFLTRLTLVLFLFVIAHSSMADEISGNSFLTPLLYRSNNPSLPIMETVFWTDDFENATSPSSGTRIPSNTGGGMESYFKRAMNSDLDLSTLSDGNYSNIEGSYFWAGEDHDEAFGVGEEVQEILWTVDISGRTNLLFQGNFAAQSENQAWDPDDYIIVEYQIDGGGYNALIAFYSNSSLDKQLAEDFNGDQIGEGEILTKNFTEFQKTISGTGSALQLRIRVHSNSSSNEEWAIDNFRLLENAANNYPPEALFVSMAGNPTTGQVLTGNYIYVDDDADSESGSTYQWYRSDDNMGTNKIPIGGAMNITFALTSFDENKYISFEVIPNDGADAGLPNESMLLGPVQPIAGSGEILYWQDNFEDPSSPSSGTRTPSENGGSSDSYFKRTTNSDINTSTASDGEYTNIEGSYFWAGEDHDGAFGSGEEEQNIVWSVDITGQQDLIFRGFFGAQGTFANWENVELGFSSSDYIVLEYRIDASAYQRLIAFYANNATDRLLAEDTNIDDIGDGIVLSKAFQEFEKNIPGSGNTLDLRLRASSNGSNSEELAVENFRLFAMAPPTVITPDANNILYVDKNVDKSDPNYIDGAGNSWKNAVTELAIALQWAREQYDADNNWLDNDSLQIYVAQGNYNPLYNAEDGNYDQNGNRDNAFVMVKNVQLYGGFDPGNGITDLTDNRILPTLNGTQGTILNGDLNGDDGPDFMNYNDNAYHVMLAPTSADGFVVNGVTIRGGNGDGGSADMNVSGSTFIRQRGGGLYNQATGTVVHTKISHNQVKNTGGDDVYGGGILSTGNTVYSHLILNENHSDDFGGGMFTNGGNILLTNSLIVGNTATEGGGTLNINSFPTLRNVVIFENTASGNGGGIYNSYFSSSTLTNVTFSGNTAHRGGGIYNDIAETEIYNSIFWGNVAIDTANEIYDIEASTFVVSHSIVQGGYTGTNNIDADPLFANPANGDYSFLAGSPAVNTGDNTLYTNAGGDLQNDLDLAGNGRVYDVANGGVIDMGAYEFQTPLNVCPVGIAYVDSIATGANNGTSWANAFTDLQDALQAVRECSDMDSIFVAKGTYYPTPDGMNRDSSFVIPDSAVVLGGFPSGGGMLADRDWELNLTVLNGDIDLNGALSGNSYHIVETINVDSVTIVDGFTITGGNADGAFPLPSTGGGWFNNGMGNGNSSNPTIRNCKITGNNSSTHGAGLYNDGRSEGDASPIIENCTFSNNTGGLFGGAIFNNAVGGASSPRFRDTRIIDNSSANNGGGVCNFANNGTSSPVFINCQISGNQTNASAGGIYNYVDGGGVSSPVLINTVVSGNSAGTDGGGMYNYALNGESAPKVINSVFSGNKAGINGGAMYNYGAGGIPEIINSIFYNNDGSEGETFANFNSGFAVVEYSLFQGDYTSLNGNCTNCIDTSGGGNLFLEDPLFVNAPLASAAPTAEGNFRVQVCSPAINAGDSAANMEPEDADGYGRIFGAEIDMGAYEFQAPGGPAPQPVCPPDFFVCFGASAVSLVTDHPGQPGGGTFSGPGVALDSFYAVNAGTGMHEITYTYTDGNGCVDSCNFVITVGEETVVTCPADFSIAGNAAPVALTGGVPAGGTFSGPGVSAGMFDPAQASMGLNEIEYTVMDDSSCVFSCTFMVTVTAAVNADYEVTTNDNELIITDISGNGDTLTMSENGANVRFFATGRTYSLDSGPVQNLPVDVALAGTDTIRIRAAAGDDMIQIDSFTSLLPSLEVSGGGGDDQVRFIGDLSFMPDAHLTADLQADGATPGEDRIAVTNGTEIRLSGSGRLTYKVSRNIEVNGATSLVSAENGDIVMEANQQSIPTSGNFHGIYINGSTIEYTGTGNIFLKGRGGNSGYPTGIWLNNGKIIGGATGLVDIEGIGRIGGDESYIVIPAVYLAGGEVKTTGADIRIEGTGTETSGGHGNRGIYNGSCLVSARNLGNVTLIGSGGMASGNSNEGITILGSGAIVESEDGNIDITGTGGGAGNGAGNYGVHINGIGLVRSTGTGHINIYGEGGKGTGDNNTGVRLYGNLADRVIASAGSITIHGVGGGSGTSDENHGISNLTASKVETASGSKIEFIGEKGVGENSASILLDNTSQINALANTSHILFRGDNMRFSGGIVNTPDSVTIKPFTEDGSVNIDLGSTADPLNGPLSLADAELDRVSAGRLIIGSENADSIVISTDISRNTATTIELISGSDIIFSGGGVQTGGGTLLLHPGDSPAAVYPRYDGNDVNASTLSFASDIAIEVNGTVPGNGMGGTYTQLEVIGSVDLTGDDLVLTGSYVPTGGESFVILSNDGSDAVVGTFNSLPEGSIIPNFLGSGLDALISYTGGDGNDVVVTVLNGCPVSGVVYVDSTALGLSDGTSWLNAFTNLQEALEAVRNCPNVDSVLVAEGTYYPTPDDMDRGSSFVIPDSTVVMGGFPSGGGSIEDRDMQCELFPTVLSGDIDRDGTLDGNSYHVVRTTNVDTTTIVDGFVITGGNADGVNPDIVGGGWLNIGSGSDNRSNPKILNCKFIDNNANSHGGALYNDGRSSGNASPIIRNTSFLQNTAGVFGGAIFNGGLNGISSPVIENCIVTDNYAGNLGGGVFNFANGGVSSPLILHCKISGNSAQASGGGMYNYVDGGGESSPEIINSIISGNSAGTSGGGLYNYGQNGISSPVIINTVFASNNGGSQGGAVVNTEIGGESSPVIINSIFYRNEANQGDVFYNFGQNINVSAQYSLFQTNYIGLNENCNSCVDAPAATNKFESDPLFAYSPLASAAPTASGDFRLMRNSPAIDMGLNNPVTVMEDLDDLSRVFNGTVDIGAYEWREYCKQDTVYLDENGEALTSIEELDLIGDLPSLTNCVLDTVVELVQTEFTCEDTAGLYNIYLIKPLSFGMSDTLFRCEDTIWVLDTISPRIGLIDTTLYVGADCIAEMPDLSEYGMDNCDVDTVIQSPEAGVLINAGMMEVELSVIDSSGNQRDTTFVLEVLDTISPTIGLIDTTLYADADCSSAMPDLSGYGMDNCAVDTVIQSPEVGMVIPAGMTTVELSVIDSSGNSTDTMFILEVLDTISPRIGLIDTTLYVGADCSVGMPDLSGYGMDNCLLDTVIQVPAVGEVLSAGLTEVMLTVSDSSGNTTDTVFMMEVLDTISPTFDPVPAGMDTVYVDVSCTGVIEDYSSLAMDNCGIDSVMQIPDAGTEVMPGLLDIVLEVWDQSGNSTDTSFTIEILDTISPVIAMEEVELMLDNECMATMPDLSSYASDNCGVERFIQEPAVDENLGLPGTIVMVTLTAIDSSGNETIETFDIEVQ